MSYAVAGDISVNLVNSDKAYAFINDTGPVTSGGSLVVQSTGDDEIWSLAGAVAISLDGEESSTALAGSISVNVINGDMQAFVKGATIDALGAHLLAERTGGIRSLTAAGSGAPAEEGIAAAGSISINVDLTSTEAYLEGVIATLGGSSSVRAIDESQIWAIAGAVGLGGSGGYGFGVGINLLGSDQNPNVTRAYIDNSQVTIGSGLLEVSAVSQDTSTNSRIVALTGSIGVGLGPDGSEAGAGTLSVNIISDDTDAWIKSSVITDAAADAAALDTIVQAQDASGISAVSGAIGLSSGSSLGLAISYNEINNDVSAYLDNVDLTSGGTLTLDAQSNEEIGTGTVGVAAAVGGDAIWPASGRCRSTRSPIPPTPTSPIPSAPPTRWAPRRSPVAAQSTSKPQTARRSSRWPAALHSPPRAPLSVLPSATT